MEEQLIINLVFVDTSSIYVNSNKFQSIVVLALNSLSLREIMV